MTVPKVKIREEANLMDFQEPRPSLINPENKIIDKVSSQVEKIPNNPTMISLETNSVIYPLKSVRPMKEGDIVFTKYIPVACFISKISMINPHVALLYTLDFKRVGYTRDEDIEYKGITLNEETLKMWNYIIGNPIKIKKKKFGIF
jgi:hypothetical protein